MLFAGHMYVGLYVLYIFVQVEGDLVHCMLFAGHMYVGL